MISKFQGLLVHLELKLYPLKVVELAQSDSQELERLSHLPLEYNYLPCLDPPRPSAFCHDP
uniref:Uncharacterized protein n=1 Tax=Picea sitchensis TaxID=3332 RepID=A0A6B9XXM5_PICSI|nr:hypothetical protein Q903MT_gene4360 [Picea sitchensis]